MFINNIYIKYNYSTSGCLIFILCFVSLLGMKTGMIGTERHPMMSRKGPQTVKTGQLNSLPSFGFLYVSIILNIFHALCSPKPTLEEVRSWGQSFDKLMCCPAGRNSFRQFLRTEFSEENMLFWLACDEFSKDANKSTVEEKARVIYEDYISILSPKEVWQLSLLLNVSILSIKLFCSTLYPSQIFICHI